MMEIPHKYNRRFRRICGRPLRLTSLLSDASCAPVGSLVCNRQHESAATRQTKVKRPDYDIGAVVNLPRELIITQSCGPCLEERMKGVGEKLRARSSTKRLIGCGDQQTPERSGTCPWTVLRTWLALVDLLIHN